MEQIPETVLTERQKYIGDLEQFITQTQTQMSTVLQKLSWTPEHFLKPEDRVVCPNDEGHIMPPASIEKHLPICRLTKLGFHKDEMDVQLHDYKAVHGDNPDLAPVIIDEKILNDILLNHSLKNNLVYYGKRPMPATPQQELATLTREERLAVYEYVTEKAKKGNELLNVEKDDILTVDWQAIVKNGGLFKDDASKPRSHVERLAELRDYKRRRQSYRAKNVHITQKSYTEIIREVIKNQIEVLDPAVITKISPLKVKAEPRDKSKEDVEYNESVREETREKRRERSVDSRTDRGRERSVESGHRHKSKKHKHKDKKERSHRHRSKHKKRRHNSRDHYSSRERSTSRD
ncbi:U11/U12 small nuclear ribonucleoprotein 48 kDa protein-like [Gigantopelta aegis]|uniref:U11/U12 small nuclear ribonucleoprotein 48 kDa protein-like n=1 Tax=Gigantopelta aegis TaxID=1735272 RepID=UPI001B88D613|nr:U11/U12 small nuclear ribonucleoprotein 48 kDa protein-like [Gigantopelta aegis]XP_041354508.1 U11/U12 small nuclear ribonucleoprotein 48 kDa protein-like [Gigantopelta aegis]